MPDLTVSSFIDSLMDDANQAAAQTTLGLVPGTDVQAYDADLAALSSCQTGAAAALALLTQSEVEVLDGATISTAELNYLSGVTSGIQSQINGKMTSWTITGDTGSDSVADGTSQAIAGTTDEIVTAEAANTLSIGIADNPTFPGTYVSFPTKADPDPTGASGQFYYNTTDSKFKAYESAAWNYVLTHAGGVTTGQVLRATGGTTWAFGAVDLTSSDAVTGALGIANGGSGQTTAQAAIDALSQVSGATNEHVLTKDTASGNAIWKVAPGITDLNGETGTTQTFSDVDDTNVTLTITSATNDHEFALGWTGTLADGRITSAATWNAKLANVVEDTTPQLGGPLDLNNEPLTIECKNDSGAALDLGDAVYQSGFDTGVTDLPEITLADADAAGSAMPAIGIVTEPISNGSTGTVALFGELVMSTTGWSVGDALYVVDASGAPASGSTLTNTKPTGDSDLQKVATVLRVGGASVGRVFLSGANRTNDIPNFTAAEKFWYGGSGGVATEGTFGTNVRTWLETPSSANLAAAVTGETGSGALVFATSPTLVTPALGTPSSGNLGSCTAYPGDSSLVTTGTVTAGTWSSDVTMQAADTIQIPSGAGGSEALSAAGQLTVDTTLDNDTGDFNFHDGQAERVLTPTYEKGFVIEDPTASENISLGWYTVRPITIRRVAVGVRGTTPSLTWRLDHGTNRTSGTAVWTAAATTDTTTGEIRTSFTDDTIPADSFIWFVSTASSGTVTEIHATVFYTYDA